MFFMKAQQTVIHEDFIAHCMDILKSAYDTITVIKKQKEKKEIEDLTLKICRTMKVLHEYIRWVRDKENVQWIDHFLDLSN